MQKGQSSIVEIFVGIVVIFLIAGALGPVLNQISPQYSGLFTVAMIAIIIAAIFTAFGR